MRERRKEGRRKEGRKASKWKHGYAALALGLQFIRLVTMPYVSHFI
jgi:hypothetical protein